MATVQATTRSGATKVIEGQQGRSVMQVLRDGGIDDLLAICGGACSCATCHVYIDPPDAAGLPPISEMEDALLDGSEHRRATSRLSCQLPVDGSWTTLRLTVAPED